VSKVKRDLCGPKEIVKVQCWAYITNGFGYRVAAKVGGRGACSRENKFKGFGGWADVSSLVMLIEFDLCYAVLRITC
jgi:hypothetical protein